MPANECIALYDPGRDITGHCTVAVIGKRCVMITANRQAKTNLSTPQVGAADPTGGGNYSVGPATAAGRIFGVAAYDAAIGEKVPVLRGKVVPIKSAGAIAAFAEVEVGAAGQVVTKAAGVAIGVALTGCASGDDCEVALYN
jgi:hypothetical protein